MAAEVSLSLPILSHLVKCMVAECERTASTESFGAEFAHCAGSALCLFFGGAEDLALKVNRIECLGVQRCENVDAGRGRGEVVLGRILGVSVVLILAVGAGIAVTTFRAGVAVAAFRASIGLPFGARIRLGLRTGLGMLGIGTIGLSLGGMRFGVASSKVRASSYAALLASS
ncbi:hypothetical protein CTheo_9237 [Ceratobasidium theobromae]|uniref:Transmembrane protein n=1 Tax=Ceratobasidium theobromae TaxID=1582974 RepID=A0A5N5Q7B6_9AGAM|nr:hypothetical protein CTheo_9237 [Ceratobasidium theobromae]